MRNVTFTVELDNDRLTDDHDLRRMFFFQDNKTSFSITRQISLTKENEWYCKFLDIAYLRVSYATIHYAAQILVIVFTLIYSYCEQFCFSFLCLIFDLPSWILGRRHTTQGGGMGWENGVVQSVISGRVGAWGGDEVNFAFF